MIKKSPACCVMQRFCRCYSEILWVNNIVANKLAYSVHYFSDMMLSVIFYFLWQRKNSSCRLKSLKIWIAYISLCWRKTYFLFRRICIRKCNQQPTLKFKDDRRSVTTEEIWVNRMARLKAKWGPIKQWPTGSDLVTALYKATAQYMFQRIGINKKRHHFMP